MVLSTPGEGSEERQPNYFVEGSFNITKQCPRCWYNTKVNERDIISRWTTRYRMCVFVIFCGHEKCKKVLIIKNSEMPKIVSDRILNRLETTELNKYVCSQCEPDSKKEYALIKEMHLEIRSGCFLCIRQKEVHQSCYICNNRFRYWGSLDDTYCGVLKQHIRAVAN